MKREAPVKKRGRNMQYTFEILAAGCNTRCGHCYVSGGPSKSMPYESYLYCLKKLKPVLDRVPGGISVTPGNEPFNHPEICGIMRETRRLMPEYYPGEDFSVPTTGIALLARSDREEILRILGEMGCRHMLFSLHGGAEHHNRMVANEKGFSCIGKAADYLHEHGFEPRFNLILSKYLIEDWDQVLEFLDRHHCGRAFLTIPLYLPVERLRGFQPFRAEYGDCEKLRGRLDAFGISEAAFFRKVEENHERAIARRAAMGWDYEAAERSKPQWAFFHITQDLSFFYGNAGMHTKYLGNLRTMSDEELCRAILEQGPNYDYSAYYQVRTLPPVREVLSNLEPLKTDYVYPDPEGCLYRWFDLCGVKTILLE